MHDGIGTQFMELTKYRRLGPSDQEKGLPQPPLEWPAEENDALALPDPQRFDVGGTALRDVIERRSSLRAYAATALSLDELAFLLWASQGVRRVAGDRATFRTVPSAGARHALETIVWAHRVASIAPGLYRYRAIEHRLASWNPDEEVGERLVAACLGQGMVREAAATFVWVADRYRMAWRYGERGTRYVHLDAGHACQNLYLAAEAIDAGACAVAAFDDDRLNDLLGVDGVDRFAVYLAAVGKRA
jgi:SagB-type dehydrogenase family enzyme